MMDNLNDKDYRVHPTLVRALDILFILHAEHELNCSTAAVRHLSSAGTDVYTCIAGGAAALYGPKHGGANEAVLRMLESIGSVDNIPKFVEEVK
jgi:citrate synthase